MNRLLKKTSLCISLAGLMFLQSCADRVVGTAIVAVVVASVEGNRASAVAVEDRKTDPRQRNKKDTKEAEKCYVAWDINGKRITTCIKRDGSRTVTRQNFMSLHGGNVEAILDSLEENNILDIFDLFDFAKANDLTLESAEILVDALNNAKNGDLSSLNELGLDDKSLNLISMLKMPSDEAITTLSISLNQYEIMTRAMIARMLNTARELQDDLELLDE